MSSGAWSAGATLQLTPGTDAPEDIFPYISYKIAESKGDIAEQISGGEFLALEDKRSGFGRAKDPLLLVLDVENTGETSGSWVLSTGRVVVLAMEFCQLYNSGVLECFDSVNDSAIGERLQQYHSHVLEFSLQPGEKRRLAIRFHGSNISIIYPSLKSALGHQKMISANFLTTVGASTATLVLIIVNACLYLLIRNTAFGFFVLAELAFLYQSLHLVNYTTIYLFPNNFALGGFFSSLAHVCFGAFSVRFAQVFLSLRQNAPRLNSALNAFLVLAALIALAVLVQRLIPFTSSRNVVFLSVFISTLASCILPFIGIWSVIRLGAYYIPLMISWLILGGVIVWYTLSAMSVLTGAHEFRYWFGIIGFVEALFISISIALSIRTIQNRELAAQSELQKELQEKLKLVEQSKELALKRNMALTELAEKGRLLLAAGHDAKNFLGAMRHLSASLLNSSSDNKTVAEEVSNTAGMLNRTLSVIVSSSSAGASREDILALETLDVESLFGALKLIHERDAIARGIVLGFRSNVSCFPGDRTLVMRVLSNFISNAIKYSDRGRVLVVARLRENAILFQVYDQGRGIPAESLSQILDPQMERLRLNNDITGQGVGLTIVQRLAGQMGAKVDASSIQGTGSRFDLILPVFSLPPQSSRCLLLPSDIIQKSAKETVDATITLVELDQLGEDESDFTIFVTAARYSQLEAGDLLPNRSRIVLVTHDKSMEFRDVWCDRVGMIIYSPMDEGLVFIAIDLLERSRKEKIQSGH
ncbi:MAG: ATP-binding protein [Halioglobus sp.]